MKIFIFMVATFTISTAFALPEPVPSSLPKAVSKKVETSGKRLLDLDCPFLLQIFHPKDEKQNELALCIHTAKEERGIFMAYACIAALAEPDSQAIHPFYGKKGHWGVEGKCSTEQMVKKLNDSTISTTVNPFTSFRLKREEGFEVRLLRDDLRLWESVKPVITPKKDSKKK